MGKTKTIQDRILQYIAFLGVSEREFARQVGISSGYLNSLKAGTTPGTEKVLKILSAYPDLNDQWLLNGVGEMIVTKKTLPKIAEPDIIYVAPNDNQVSIPITEIKAAAGSGYMNTEVLRTSEFIQLPTSLTKTGKYLCVRIKGNSMSPTLQDGGYVVIRLLERGEWEHILSDRVYVVSDIENQTFLKRIRNRFKNGFIVLTSDNPDKATYPNFNLKTEEITSIWYVEWYLSAKMPNVHDQFYSKVERLENSIDDINRKFAELEKLELKSKKS